MSIGTIILCAQEVSQIIILNRTKINNRDFSELVYPTSFISPAFIACLSFSKLKLITTILLVSSGFHLPYLCWWLCSPSLIATARLTQQNLSGRSSFCCPSSTTSILLGFAGAASAAVKAASSKSCLASTYC